jgi:hypothetical protein
MPWLLILGLVLLVGGLIAISHLQSKIEDDIWWP